MREICIQLFLKIKGKHLDSGHVWILTLKEGDTNPEKHQPTKVYKYNYMISKTSLTFLTENQFKVNIKF